MLRAWMAGLALALALLVGAALGPVEAANVYKLTLPAGTHELVIGGEELVVWTSDDVVVDLSAARGLIHGIIEAAESSVSVRVTITLIGPPDTVIYDGRVEDVPVEFEATSSEETGHAEL
jgi:hypothetical protein